jgi:hypothetical protein
MSVHHADLGAALARDAGASTRCSDLIAWHGCSLDAADAHLLALAAADNAAIR